MSTHLYSRSELDSAMGGALAQLEIRAVIVRSEGGRGSISAETMTLLKQEVCDAFDAVRCEADAIRIYEKMRNGHPSSPTQTEMLREALASGMQILGISRSRLHCSMMER